MRHFPIFVDLRGQTVSVVGGGPAAIAKLRLLLKTEANIWVFAKSPDPQIEKWFKAGRLEINRHSLTEKEAARSTLIYAAEENDYLDQITANVAKKANKLANIVDNLDDSDFITPAIVDRDPVTVAIGTEGAAPVLAREIKRTTEEILPTNLGQLTKVGQAFRGRAQSLPEGRIRRDFWSEFYFSRGPSALEKGGEAAANAELEKLFREYLNLAQRRGFVWLVGAGPGDPELLTHKARKALHEADVVLHDQLVSPEILELARREALIVETGKKGFGPSWSQDDITALMVEHAGNGAQVVRLKSGDPTIFGRLDEEIEGLEQAHIPYTIVPGVSAASAAAAAISQSLTKRKRNSSLRFLTGHDINGFADQDWRALAQPQTVAAIYMGKHAAKFLRARLLMHGASEETALTIVENVSRYDQKIIGSNILEFPDEIARAGLQGPAVLLLGLSPRNAVSVLDDLPNKIQENA